jgi:hypothetical protein
MEEFIMKLRTHSNQQLPIANYSHAISEAVSWLGERYLLALPVKAHHPRVPPPQFLMAGQPSHPSST